MPVSAVIIDVVRTPMGKGRPDGALASLHPVDLLAQTLTALVERSDLDPASVEDIITGCVTQAGEQAATPGRQAALAAGFPLHVPGTTIDRKCGSGQQAVLFAVQAVISGMQDIVIACGVESMSRVKMGSAVMGQDPFGPAVKARLDGGPAGQGIAAELVSARWGITREELDRYSCDSHRKAEAIRSGGGFSSEICAIQTPDSLVAEDETIRAATTLEKLAGLPPAFHTPHMADRFPEINWRITAGNSSQITDGAAAALIMSEAKAVELGLRPRCRIVAADVCGADPVEMLTATIPSSKRALLKSGLGIGQIDHFEVNEAFACVPMAWMRDVEADPARVNPRGGAIALGHPLGASGVRLLATMLNALEQTGGTYGLQTMCEAGGMANTTIIERL